MAKETKIKISELIPDDKNFNSGSEYGQSLIQKSFEKFGAGRSILIDRNNKIIAGNKSTENYCALGNEDVIVVESDGKKLIAVKRTDIDLDTPEGREMALADNATAKANIVWAEDVIAETIGVEVAESWGVDFKQQEVLEAEEDDFNGVAPKEPITVLGDLYEIGEHRLLCGSSTEADSVTKLLNGKEPYLMVTDPPYGVEYKPEWRSQAMPEKNNATHGRTIGKVMNDDNADWTEAWALSPSKVAYVYHDPKNSGVVLKSLNDCAFEIRSQIIWYKSNFVISRCDYHPMHEPLWYAVRKGSKGNWASDRKQTTVWEINKNQKNETGHSTQKPIECMAKPIANHDGDVYDPFLGSGTTMVASHQLKRKCYGMELDPKYCDVIVARMINLDSTLEIKRNGVKLSKNELQKFTENTNG